MEWLAAWPADTLRSVGLLFSVALWFAAAFVWMTADDANRISRMTWAAVLYTVMGASACLFGVGLGLADGTPR